MTEAIVLIGAGSASFTHGLTADLIRTGWQAELRLVDIDPAALEVARGVCAAMIAASGAPITLRADTDRRKLLPGATAIIMTVGVGGRRAWEHDVFIPRRHGIHQPVGDTVGPGGTSRGLRMVPALVAIARDVLDLAPEALFFNYSNPMAVCCRAIVKATGAPVIGLCHGVNHVAHYLADALGVPQADLRYEAVGINHLTWFTRITVDGHDQLPRLRKLAEERDDNPFAWQLLRLFGAFPAVLDRHIVEFFPQFYRDGTYGEQRLGHDAFSFEGTIAGGDAQFARMGAVARGEEPVNVDPSGGEHEQVMAIIGSIRADDGAIYSANLPNTGQVPGLPDGVVVESPAVATGGTLRPVAMPPLSPGLLGTLATRFQWAEVVVDAALSGERDLVVQALVLDGCCSSLAQAESLCDELLAAWDQRSGP
ncbi:MAG: hypothetical protein HZB16_18075 [Armatimonadetes bacterium]|nr:hypothetical protein [Armatimonadota bacterium]